MIGGKQKLKDVCIRITKGTTPTTYGYAFVDKGINYFKAESITEEGRILPNTFAFIDEATHDYLKRSVLATDDILISIAGAKLGKCGFLTEQFLPANTNQAVGIVRVNPDCAAPKYVFYNFLNKQTYQLINSLNSQSAQPNFNLGQLGDLEFNYPPLPIQCRIASVLSAYDDLMENNLKRIKLLEDAARCEYKMLMEEGRKQLVFRELVKWVKGKKPKDISQMHLEGYLPYLVFDTIEGNAVTYANIERVPLASTNDVLMCMDGARSGVVFRGMEGVLGSTFAALQIENSALTEFVYQFLQTNLEYVVQGNVGAAIPHANKEYINSMKIVIPDEVRLEEYNGKVRPLVILTANLKSQNAQLRQARDILLPRLMSGEINVVGDITKSTMIEMPICETMAAEHAATYSKTTNLRR